MAVPFEAPAAPHVFFCFCLRCLFCAFELKGCGCAVARPLPEANLLRLGSHAASSIPGFLLAQAGALPRSPHLSPSVTETPSTGSIPRNIEHLLTREALVQCLRKKQLASHSCRAGVGTLCAASSISRIEFPNSASPCAPEALFTLGLHSRLVPGSEWQGNPASHMARSPSLTTGRAS